MKQYLLLRNVKVENANAVAGLTWGFPAISQFLGFTHALDRKLRKADLSIPPVLGGCAIICHQHQAHTEADPYGTHHFCLTRNPLTKEGKTAPFNEEGRMHMEISLIIELNFSLDSFYTKLGRDDVLDNQLEVTVFLDSVVNQLGILRVAGGLCVSHGRCEIISIESNSERSNRDEKRVLFSLLPGFALVDRTDLLQIHFDTLKSHEKDISLIEAWMDFGGLRYRYFAEDPNKGSEDKQPLGEWGKVALPEQGWFVPILTGFQPIAPLQEPLTTAGSRDMNFPVSPVEGIYGVGQWLAPFRVKDIASLIWRYQFDDTGYHFQNCSDFAIT